MLVAFVITLFILTPEMDLELCTRIDGFIWILKAQFHRAHYCSVTSLSCSNAYKITQHTLDNQALGYDHFAFGAAYLKQFSTRGKLVTVAGCTQLLSRVSLPQVFAEVRSRHGVIWLKLAISPNADVSIYRNTTVNNQKPGKCCRKHGPRI